MIGRAGRSHRGCSGGNLDDQRLGRPALRRRDLLASCRPDAQMSSRLHRRVPRRSDLPHACWAAFTGEVPDHYEVARRGGVRRSETTARRASTRASGRSEESRSRTSAARRAVRFLVAERDDRNSLRHWLSPLGTALHIDDADTSGLASWHRQVLEDAPRQPLNHLPPSERRRPALNHCTCPSRRDARRTRHRKPSNDATLRDSPFLVAVVRLARGSAAAPRGRDPRRLIPG